jgi:hypothetical protein
MWNGGVVFGGKIFGIPSASDRLLQLSEHAPVDELVYLGEVRIFI